MSRKNSLSRQRELEEKGYSVSPENIQYTEHSANSLSRDYHHKGYYATVIRIAGSMRGIGSKACWYVMIKEKENA